MNWSVETKSPISYLLRLRAPSLSGIAVLRLTLGVLFLACARRQDWQARIMQFWADGNLGLITWLAMLGFMSVSYTPQTTHICVCCRHVDNVGPTCRWHSVKSAFVCWQSHVGESYPQHTFLPIGRKQYWWGSHNIHKDKKNWDPLRSFILLQVLVLVIFICVTFNCTVSYVQSY